MKNLLEVFNAMDYDINEFPEAVMNRTQNISLKFSPYDLDLELITRFSVDKSFLGLVCIPSLDRLSRSVRRQIHKYFLPLCRPPC